jgi:hypothetical protein
MPSPSSLGITLNKGYFLVAGKYILLIVSSFERSSRGSTPLLPVGLVARLPPKEDNPALKAPALPPVR